jgi:polar amino acid transport system substrate-binding protein
MKRTRLLTMGLAAFVALIALVAAGCGSSNNDNTSSTGATLTAASFTATKDPTIAAQAQKAKLVTPGQLSVAADATYAPDEFFGSDNKTVIGMDADLAKAIAQVMGLQPAVSNQTFDSIIPGLAAGKYDLGMSSFTDTKDREKTVDFVTYATAGESFFVNVDGGPAINSINDICGLKVGAEKGTTEADDAAAQSKKCTAAGKPAVSVSTFQDEAGVNVALSSGRVDAGFADTPVADYAVKQSNGKFALSPAPSLANAPYGIAMAKDSGLQQPVLAAVKKLMDDGTYKDILDYWGLSGIAIDNPTIDGAID